MFYHTQTQPPNVRRIPTIRRTQPVAGSHEVEIRRSQTGLVNVLQHDLVVLAGFPFGGMEHAGATFLREEAILLDAAPTAAQLARRRQLVLHETAHQWMGDLVTMRWFDDLWLKEGFANFLAELAAGSVTPELPARVAFHALKTSAVHLDASKPAGRDPHGPTAIG